MNQDGELAQFQQKVMSELKRGSGRVQGKVHLGKNKHSQQHKGGENSKNEGKKSLAACI